jgi:hypothetical protein
VLDDGLPKDRVGMDLIIIIIIIIGTTETKEHESISLFIETQRK